MDESTTRDIFGLVQIGYVVLESEALERWKAFLIDGVGMHLASSEDDSHAYSIDQHQVRILIQRGTAEDILAIGYQLKDEATLQEILNRLKTYKIQFQNGTDEEAKLRGVSSFIRLTGPNELFFELFVDAKISTEKLSMKASAFVTGAGGMGHFGICTKKSEEMSNFWKKIFDARHSDIIIEKVMGVTVVVEFLRLNHRHHSLAIAATRGMSLNPVRTKIQHINVEVAELDDLTDAYRRLHELGFKMMHEIGQHPNDLEISFYAISPSGFEFEVGWRAKTVDEFTWKTAVYFEMSLWGHRFPAKAHVFAIRPTNFARSLKSLFKNEYSPLKGIN